MGPLLFNPPLLMEAARKIPKLVIPKAVVPRLDGDETSDLLQFTKLSAGDHSNIPRPDIQLSHTASLLPVVVATIVANVLHDLETLVDMYAPTIWHQDTLSSH
jgi:hypothetical protein